MPIRGQSIPTFDVWRARYGGATVEILKAGTTQRAAVYLDPDLSQPADNPQILQSLSVNIGEQVQLFGKWTAPVYVNEAVELNIDSSERTGILRPGLVSLNGEDASDAYSATKDNALPRKLKDRFADAVNALDFGNLADSPAENTTTLQRAIGVAAARNGSYVLLPAQQITFNTVDIPAGVVLVGQGRGATTLLSQSAQEVVTISGERAGLMDLTLDGISLIPGSVGVFAEPGDAIVLDNCEIKRFETGLKFFGGQKNNWRDLYVTNCSTGCEFRGDIDVGNGSIGSEFSYNTWTGGEVSVCSQNGLYLLFHDELVRHNSFRHINFDGNLTNAIKLHGARYTKFEDCLWVGNTTNILIEDDTNTAEADNNTVIGVKTTGGSTNGGTNSYAGTCQDVLIDRHDLVGVTYQLNSPQSAIVLSNVTEDANCVALGSTTKLVRRNEAEDGAIFGVTSDASAVVAWNYTLDPGQQVIILAKIRGRQRNGTDHAEYYLGRAAIRPGSQLVYQAQTVNFTVGAVLTGALSGAQARIAGDSDSGTSGTLTLIDIVGDFQNGETITDSQGGSATVNGVLVPQNAALIGSTTNIMAATETDATWDAAFSVLGGDVRISVQGAAAKTVEWTVDVDVEV